MMNARMWFAVAVAAAVVAAPASAQQRPQRGAGFGGSILALPQVVEELKLTEEQKTKLKDSMPSFADLRAKLQDVPENERREKMRELTEAASKKAAEVLTESQQKRLKEIQLQTSFPRSLMQPEVSEALKLTDDQKSKIQEIVGTNRPRGEGARPARPAQGNPREAIERMQAQRKETREKVQALLSDDQKKAWKELTGAPFEIQAGARPGAGGRPPEGAPRRRPGAQRNQPEKPKTD